jgi:hypothetical protein
MLIDKSIVGHIDGGDDSEHCQVGVDVFANSPTETQPGMLYPMTTIKADESHYATSPNP